MTNAAMAGWQCGTCLVQNDNAVSRCVACETPKEPVIYDGPPIVFGGGQAAPVDISQPTALTSRTSTLACNTPQAIAQAPMAFCKAMTTPISRSEAVFLAGCESTDLIDKTDCIGNLKVRPGRLKTWGSGECEQLPIKSDLTDEFNGVLKPLPIRCFEDRSATQICCGSLTSYALRDNNEVWSWGCPDNGPLGRPVKNGKNEAWDDILPPDEFANITSAKVPERVWCLPTDDRIIKIVAGDSHAGVLTESGDVYMWGHYRDFTGPLGFWNGDDIVDTQFVPLKLALPGVALDIASGENHTVILVQCASTRDKRCLVVMGSNEFGQLCTVPSLPPLPAEVGGSASLSLDQSISFLTPIDISPESYQDVRHQYLKPHVIPVEKLVFNLWRKKANVNGKIINEFQEMFQSASGDATPSREDLKITKVCAGSATTFLKVVDAGDSLWFACGRGYYGELGGGFTEQAMYNPTLVTMPNLCAFDSIVGGDFATFALASDGSIWAWGKGELCGLGSSSEAKILAPKAIPGLRNKCHAVSCGMKTTYALTHAGFAFVWGEGNNYQLGLGANEDLVTLPTRIPPEYFDNEAVVEIVAGSNHVVSLINEIIERRGAKRSRMLDDIDEMPSVMKKSRIEGNETPPPPALSGVLEESLIDRPSLMFLPTAPLSPKISATRSSPKLSPLQESTCKDVGPSQTPKFAMAETTSRVTTGQIDQVFADLADQNLLDIAKKPAAPTQVVENTQRPTLMPHMGEEEMVNAPEPTAYGDETDEELSPESQSNHASEPESLEMEQSDVKNALISDSHSGVEVDVSGTEAGEPNDGEDQLDLVVPPGTAASSRKISPKSKRTTPVQKRVDSIAMNKTPISKPRDSLTAVLISADRPYDDTPKPSQGEFEPERELERAMAEESDKGDADEVRDIVEETVAATSAKAKGKARAKPKAKGKAKAKAKGRPGRKPKAQVDEEPSAHEEEVVAEDEPVATKRAPSRRGRTARNKLKDEESLSSVIDSGDEEVENSPSTTAGAAKKTATGRGRAKAKVKVANKKK